MIDARALSRDMILRLRQPIDMPPNGIMPNQSARLCFQRYHAIADSSDHHRLSSTTPDAPDVCHGAPLVDAILATITIY